MTTFDVSFSGPRMPEGSVEFFSPPSGFKADPIDGQLYSPKLTERVKAIDPGDFLLVRRAFRDLEQDGVIGQFIEGAELEYGREEHAHDVRFGQLNLSSPFDRQRTELVAMKGFHRPKDAAHEFGVMQYLNRYARPSVTKVSALDTLGFYRMPDTGETALITAYDESVISYDNLFWNPEQPPTEEELHKALSRCAFALGTLHHRGLTHGDAQVKNLAVDNKGVRFIDLESAQAFPGKNGRADFLRTTERIADDIRTFAGSLVSRSEVEIDFTEPLTSSFLSRYQRVVRLPSSRVPVEARDAASDVITNGNF